MENKSQSSPLWIISPLDLSFGVLRSDQTDWFFLVGRRLGFQHEMQEHWKIRLTDKVWAEIFHQTRDWCVFCAAEIVGSTTLTSQTEPIIICRKHLSFFTQTSSFPPLPLPPLNFVVSLWKHPFSFPLLSACPCHVPASLSSGAWMTDGSGGAEEDWWNQISDAQWQRQQVVCVCLVSSAGRLHRGAPSVGEAGQWL